MLKKEMCTNQSILLYVQGQKYTKAHRVDVSTLLLSDISNNNNKPSI